MHENIVCVNKNILKKSWCPESESNQRHRDFQSLALPTELSGQVLTFLKDKEVLGGPSGTRTPDQPVMSRLL